MAYWITGWWWKTCFVRPASRNHPCPTTEPIKNGNTISWRIISGSISIWCLFINNWLNNMIEGHGDDGWKYDFPIRADFSSNVLYGPLDSGLLGHLQWALAAVTHYPEAGAQS